MFGRIGLAMAAFAALMLAGAPVMAAEMSAEMKDEKKRICAKAEKRYKRYFKKASKDEPFTVVITYKFTFCPMQVTVKQGTTVRWVNVDGGATNHNAWFKDKGLKEPERFFPKEHAEMKFDFPPGEYSYLCGPHWEKEGMTGKVIVTP